MNGNLWNTMLWAFLLPTVSFGQTPIDRIDQHTDIVQYDEVFVIGEDAWLFAGRGNIQGGQLSARYFISARNTGGDLLWQFMHDLGTPSSIWNSQSPAPKKRYAALPDDGVLIIGAWDCDVVSDEVHAIRVDAMGQELWHLLFPFYSSGPESYPPIDQLADGPSTNHALASKDSIIILNDDGEVMHRWLAPAQPVHCMRWENDTTLLVGAGTEVFRTDMDGMVLASVSLDNVEYIIDIRKDGNRVLALTTTMIAVLSDQLELENWISIPTSVAPYGFVDADDQVWLSAGGALLEIGETDLQQVLLTGTDAMAYRDGLVMTASSAGHHNRFGGRMKSYLMDGTTVSHQDDVELLATLDSTSARGISYYPDLGPVYLFHAHTTVKVVNRSGNVLNKVLLSYFAENAYGLCGTPGQTIVLDDLNLAPGDTVTVPFNDLYLMHTPYFGVSSYTETICLVAVSPNDHLDIFSDDNQWCTDVTFTVPVGMEENAAPQELKVFPNPTTGVFDVQGTLGMPANVTLIDMTGRLLHSQQTTNGRLRMDISALPSGLYMVRYETHAGTAVRRVNLMR
jgi:hypothetical protein